MPAAGIRVYHTHPLHPFNNIVWRMSVFNTFRCDDQIPGPDTIRFRLSVRRSQRHCCRAFGKIPILIEIVIVKLSRIIFRNGEGTNRRHICGIQDFTEHIANPFPFTQANNAKIRIH